MAEEIKHTDTPKFKRPKKQRRIFAKIVLVFTILLLFLVLLVSITQTRPFKNWLAGFITDKINASFEGKDAHFSFGSLDGNFFSEIILTDAVIKVKSDEMVRFSRLKADFDIFKLLNKRVELKEVILSDPTVNFTRIRNVKGDSVWNFAYLFASEKEKDTTKSEFDWKINVERLRVENLNFTMLGTKPQDVPLSAIKISNSKNLDISNLKISSLTLETSAYYDNNSVQLQIGHLGFNSNFGFDLKGLSGNFYISKTRAEINKLNIESSKSWMQMDYVFIDKLDLMNIAGLPSFKGKDLRLKMVAKKFDTEDLKSFLPAVDFLAGKVYLELTCNGKFNDINIDRCVMKTDNSDLNFHGKLVNLIEPQHLYLDVAGDNLTLDPADTKAHIPGLPVPDYSYLGKVHGSFTYKGEPTNFQTTYDVQSSCGDAKGYFDMNLTTPAIDYRGYCEVKSGNIGKVIKDEKLESNLNGKVEFSGSGFSLANIHSKITYELNNSKFGEYSWDNSSGTIALNNYNIDLTDVKYISRDVNAQVSGTMNIADINNPRYDLKGKVAGLNVAAFTKKPDDKSNLTFEFAVNGKGISPESLEGTYHINLAKSYYGKFDFIASPIDLQISTSGTGEDFVIFKSIFADVEARGKFKLTQVGDMIASNLSMIQNEVVKKFDMDTLLPIRETKISGTEADFHYKVVTKNVEAISKLLYFEDVDFAGVINGYFRNSDKGFEGSSNINIKRFAYGDSVVQMNNAKLDLLLRNNYAFYKNAPKGDFSSFYSDITFSADKLVISKQVYDSVGVDLNLANGLQGFKAGFRKDTSLDAKIAGNIDLREDTVTLNVKTLAANYNRLGVKNDDTLVVSYNPYGATKVINFDNFSISGDLLKVAVGGYYSIDGPSDIYAEMGDISIPKLTQLIYNPEALYNKNPELDKFRSPLRGNIRRVYLGFKGTVEDPKLSVEMNTGLIRYENTKIGRVDAFVDYASNLLSTDVLVSNSLGQGSLRLVGDVPFTNPISSPDSASYYRVVSSPMNLKLRAKDFQLNFFSKLIPNFADINGFLNGELGSTGTISEPALSGGMNIDKGRFLLTINNLYYRFNASFRAQNSDLIVDNLAMYYIDDDRRHLNVWGKVNFAGFRINDIDLTTSGDVKVMDRSSKANRFGFYGDLIAGIGTPAVTIKGDLNRLYVSGQLLIKEGSLLFPSLQGLEYNVYADDFVYRILDDTSGTRYLDTIVTVQKDKLEEIDPFLKYKYVLANKPSSITDNMIFDLSVKTVKNVYASINFNELTREELFGEIQADLKIQNTESKDFKFYGTMEIVGDSYYRIYYKNFKIENSRLVFDGPYDNPALHINAKYKNIRVTSNNEQEIVFVVLTITGFRYKPELKFSLEDANGIAMTGPDQGSNALSYLIFGVPINNVNASYRSDILGNLGSNVASNITSSYLSSLIRDVAPFILNTEVIYEGGSFSNGTDIRITSEIGGAIVRFGGKIFSDINNAEVTVEYPLNKLLNMNISNNLLLEFKRVYNSTDAQNKNVYETSVGLSYKIIF